MPDLAEAINAKTPKELYQVCKALIDEHLEHFLEVGQALLIIRDQKLYKPEVAGKEDGAESFSTFLEKHYESRVRAMQMLSAAETRKILVECLDVGHADDIWTCEYHYSQISGAVKPLVEEGQLTSDGEAVREKFANVDGKAPTAREEYEAILKRCALPTPPTFKTAEQVEQHVIEVIDEIPALIQRKIAGLYADLKRKADEKTIRDTLRKALKGIEDRIVFGDTDAVKQANAMVKASEVRNLLKKDLLKAAKATKKRLAKQK